MFAIERLNKIKEILYKEKRVDVFELSELFSVTEVTIRRDLDKLEREGFLIKTYGGAVINEELVKSTEPAGAGGNSGGNNSENNIEEKKMIGKIASQMIENGEAVFLSSGATCLEIARKVKDKKITVVTNDLLIGYELKDSIGIKVIVTGGDLIQSTPTLVGGFALRGLTKIYNIGKAFIDVKGVNFTSGYTVDTYEEVMAIQDIMKISNEVIIVADYTKFNSTAFARLGELQTAKKVITNKQVPNEYKKYFFEHQIKLYTAFELE